VSTAAFLAELRRRDVEVRAADGELRCSAPAGALTPGLRAELKQRKGEILEFLAAAQARAAQQRAIVPLRPHGARTPVFGVPGHNGDVFCYRALARSLGDEQPFFGLQPPGADGQGEPLTAVEDIAAVLAQQILAFRPEGPVIIAGYCAGGTTAFELAQQLQRGGATVHLLALFGSPYPAYFRLPTQAWLRLAGQAERAATLVRELAQQSWRERREYVAERLRAREARRVNAAAAALDPVLVQRAKVEHATLVAAGCVRASACSAGARWRAAPWNTAGRKTPAATTCCASPTPRPSRSSSPPPRYHRQRGERDRFHRLHRGRAGRVDRPFPLRLEPAQGETAAGRKAAQGRGGRLGEMTWARNRAGASTTSAPRRSSSSGTTSANAAA